MPLGLLFVSEVAALLCLTSAQSNSIFIPNDLSLLLFGLFNVNSVVYMKRKLFLKSEVLRFDVGISTCAEMSSRNFDF